jgi:hypothetical protein
MRRSLTAERQVDDDVVRREVLVEVALRVREPRIGCRERACVDRVRGVLDRVGRPAFPQEEPHLDVGIRALQDVVPAADFVERRAVGLFVPVGHAAAGLVPAAVGLGSIPVGKVSASISIQSRGRNTLASCAPRAWSSRH